MNTVQFPRCEFCGSSEPYKCKYCEKFACLNCSSNEGSKCVHRRSFPAIPDDWIELELTQEKLIFDLTDRLFELVSVVGVKSLQDTMLFVRAMQFGWRYDTMHGK